MLSHMPCAKNRARDTLSCLEDFCAVFMREHTCNLLHRFGGPVLSETPQVFPDAAWFINLAFLTGGQDVVIIAGPFRLFSKPTLSCSKQPYSF